MTLEDYQILSKIGEGKYSSVYRVRKLSNGLYYAMKRVSLQSMNIKERNNSFSEVKLLSALSHPNLLKFKEAFYDQSMNCLCIILEIAHKGDLSHEIKRKIKYNDSFRQEQIWQIIRQIGEGLAFLHSNNILHRDIKAHNILLFENGIVKIGDLNVASTTSFSQTRTGTLAYASPQIWKGQPYNCKSDIWSFGCLIYELMRLKRPFEGDNMDSVFKRVNKCQYEKISENYSQYLKDLVSFMIQINPKLRPSSQTIVKMAANHCKGTEIKNHSSFIPIHLIDLRTIIKTSTDQDIRIFGEQSSQNLSINLSETHTLKKRRLLHPIHPTMRLLKSRKNEQNKNMEVLRKQQEIKRQQGNEEECHSKIDTIVTPATRLQSLNIFRRCDKRGKGKIRRLYTQL